MHPYPHPLPLTLAPSLRKTRKRQNKKSLKGTYFLEFWAIGLNFKKILIYQWFASVLCSPK
ncbi:TPA: hypothetical protein ACNJX1_005024, partial [Salmonella enterica subsp. enterica serovar Newport]